jgi:iron(III) transport system substrate-binding protein
MTLRTSILSYAFLAATGIATPASAQSAFPVGYPEEYAATVEAAKKEGIISVYSSTDAKAAQPLAKDFERLYGIKVEYSDMNTTEVYNRVIAESASGQGTADVVWSASPDLQMKLLSDGFATKYRSPEAHAIPSWANYEDTLYGTTYEPMVAIYNKSVLKGDAVPADHRAIAKLLTDQKDAFRGKFATFDPERSGIGFLMLSSDVAINPEEWGLARAIGASDGKLYTSSGAIIEKVGSGEHTLGLNVFYSYALAAAKKNPNLGIILLSDYTVVTTRAAFLAMDGKHPNAGKLFLDYLLSSRGQKVATDALLFAVREDVTGEFTAQSMSEKLGKAARPVALNKDLLTTLEPEKRLKLLAQWQAALQGKE